MTVYFVGNRVTDFDRSVNGTDAIRDSVDSIRGDSRVSTDGLLKKFDVLVTSVLWYTFSLTGRVDETDSEDWSVNSSPEYATASFWDDSGNPLFYCGFDANSNNFEGRVYLRNGTTEDIIIAPMLHYIDGTKYDICIEPGVGIKIYNNRSLLFEYTGDVGNSLSSVNGVGEVGFGYGDEGTDFYVSSFLAADFDTRYATVQEVELNPVASADTSLLGDTTLLPDVVPDNVLGDYDTNVSVIFDSSGQKVVFPESVTPALPVGYQVQAVYLSWRGVRTATSPVPNVNPTVNLSGTDYTITAVPLAETLGSYQAVFENNPATSSPWSESDLTGLGYGLTLTA